MSTFVSVTVPSFFSESRGCVVSADTVNYFHAANAALKSTDVQFRKAMKGYLTYIVGKTVPANDRPRLRQMIRQL
jgi:uncharacterized membrane protein